MLAEALENRQERGSPNGADYESVIIDFLDRIERNLMSQGRPEEGMRVIYQYARELTSISEKVRDDVERLYRDYVGDLEELSSVSSRMAPNPDNYRLQGTTSRIDRPVEEEIIRATEGGDSVLLAGEAGAGKSGVLSNLYEHWKETRPVYFIDAREYGRLESRGDLESELGLRQPITDVFRMIATNSGCCTIVVDQLDNVRVERAAGMFTRLLESLAGIDDVTVVCACRRWDLDQREFEPLRDSSAFTTHTVSALDDSTVSAVLSRVGVEEDEQGQELIEIGQNLLTLSLLVDAICADEALEPQNFESEHEVWEAYRRSLDKEGSGPSGTVPYDWDEKPVERATTHALTSLLAREATFEAEDTNPADQRLISRGTIEHAWGTTYQFQHDQLQAYFFAWKQVSKDRYVQAVLDTGLDQRIAADVFEWMLKLYLDDESRSAKFLREALSRRSSLKYYPRLKIAEAAGRLGPDRLGSAQAKIVVETLDRENALRREFYRTVDSPHWIRFILDHGLLLQSDRILGSHIADLIDEAPALVLDAMEQYDPEAVTPGILYVYIDAVREADNLKPDHAAAIGKLVVSWLEEFEPDELSNTHNQLNMVLQYLLSTGQEKLVTRVVSLLSKPVKEPEITEESEQQFVLHKIEAPVDIRRLDRVLDDHIEELYDVCGASFIDTLENRLQQCLEILSDRFTDGVPAEYAYRRPQMSSRWNPRRLQDVLIPALEEAIEQQMSANPGAAESRLRMYIDIGGVYWQIAAHLLSRQPAVAPQVVRVVLQPPVDEDATSFRTDYLQLLSSGFPELPRNEQQKVIEHIRTGPDQDEQERVIREQYDWESEAELQQAVQAKIEVWKLTRLWQIRDYLLPDSDPRCEFDELRDTYGEVQFEHGRGFYIELDGRKTEPATKLDEMDADEFIDYCLDYAESAARAPQHVDNSAFEGTESELSANPAGELRTRILSDQEEYLPQLPALVRVSTGTDELTEIAFKAIVTLMIGVDHKDKEITEWSSIVDAYEQFLAVEPLEEKWDRGCRRAAVDLLRLMLCHSRSTFEAVCHIGLLVEAVLAFTDDPDPEAAPPSEDQQHTIQTTQNHYNSAAGVRAKGASSLIWLLTILEDHPLDEGTTTESLRERLSNLLTDDVAPVRFALGRHLQTLYGYDSEFVENHLDILFPIGDNPESRDRFVSAWSGYVTHSKVYEPMFNHLISKYRHAVSLHRTAAFEQHNQSLRSLCTHIAVAYAWGFVDADDDLVQELLRIEADDAAADNANESSSSAVVHLANAFDSLLSSNKDRDGHHERWDRVTEFWEHRMESITSPVDARDELRAYVQILRHAPKEQSLVEIKSLLYESAPVVQHSFSGHTLLEYLEQKTTETRHGPVVTSKAAIEVLEALTQPDEHSFPLLASDETWTIVQTAAKDNHEAALTVAERLLEAGHPEYRQIIDNYRFDD